MVFFKSTIVSAYVIFRSRNVHWGDSPSTSAVFLTSVLAGANVSFGHSRFFFFSPVGVPGTHYSGLSNFPAHIFFDIF